jgi:hypothetical protein
LLRREIDSCAGAADEGRAPVLGEWFERMGEDYMVLWWVPHGHRPTVTEAMERLEALKRKGPHAEAFTFRQTFPPPDAHRPSAP